MDYRELIVPGIVHPQDFGQIFFSASRTWTRVPLISIIPGKALPPSLQIQGTVKGSSMAVNLSVA